MKSKINKLAAATLRLIIAIMLVSGLILGVRFLVRGQATPDDALQLQQIYAAVKSAAASIPPGPDAPALRRAVNNELNNELESFVASHTNSTLTPGVRLELARNAQLRSGYLRAMDHYGRAWDSVKSSTNAVSRGVAMEALGGAAKLLALTGRMNDLDA